MELKMSYRQEPKLELKLEMQCPKCQDTNLIRSENGFLYCPSCFNIPEQVGIERVSRGQHI